MSYKHGLYGSRVASTEDITSAKNIPVYIGTAPMHRIEKNNRNINKPILIKTLPEAIRKTGYSSNDNFEEFTLSAAIYAHFQNSIQPIGPIVIINVLDTSKASSKTEEINIINKVGIIKEHVLFESISISDYELDIDYELEYTHEGYLKIIFLSEKEVPDSLSITCKIIDTSAIVESDIIGTYDEKTESRTGIMAIEDVYEDLNVVPTIITAPGFNEKAKVRQALVSSTKQISDKWEATAFTDIDSKSISNIDEAIKWKKTNGYNSNEEKLFWPKGIMGGKEIYLSILAIVAKMQTDVKYNNIPYQTPSNKQIDITGIIAKGSIIKFSQNRANELNASGITTAIYNGGKYVLWGPHMANYEDGVTSKPEEIFDTNVFMNKYLLNDFQLRNTGIVDNAMTRHDVDSLINSEQMILDSHVSSGRLLYGKIEFKSENNPVSDMINGDFTFNTLVTNTPIGKSITQKVQYTSKGITEAYSDQDKEE